MKAIPFRQVDVFTRVPFQGNPESSIRLSIGGVTVYGASGDGQLVRIEGEKIFLGGNAVTCVEGSLRAPAG